MEDTAETPEARQQQLMLALRSMAVRQATAEVIHENRDEILKRARAKLVSQGFTPEEADPGNEGA